MCWIISNTHGLCGAFGIDSRGIDLLMTMVEKYVEDFLAVLQV